MKMWILQLLIAAIPFYLAANIVEAGKPENQGEPSVRVVKRQSSGKRTAGPRVAATTGTVQALAANDSDEGKPVEGGEARKLAIAKVIRSADGEVTGKRARVRRKLEDARKRAFLGVTLTSEENDDDEGGIAVSGVVQGGPAEKAGLATGDVIVAIDGNSVNEGINALTGVLRQHEPGEEVEVVVKRNGVEQTFAVTLGSRGDSAPSVAVGPGGAVRIEDKVHALGHIILENDAGDWEIKNLGDLEALKDLPPNIKMFIPELGSRSISISVEDDEKIINIERKKDGETLVIERRGDGRIKVTRVDDEGEETRNDYAGEDELRIADKEALELLQESTGEMGRFHLRGLGKGGDFDFHFDIDTDDLHDHIFRWRTELDEALGEAHEAYERAMEEVRALRDGFHDDHEAPWQKLEEMFELHDGGLKFPGTATFKALTKPRHTFEVRTDGTIEVTIRRGDSQLVQLFEGAEDLKSREPKLYEKYQKLMEENE